MIAAAYAISGMLAKKGENDSVNVRQRGAVMAAAISSWRNQQHQYQASA